MKLLIVDDEKLARDRIMRFLTELGGEHTLEFAVNGVQALEKINSFNPEIVFLDVQMPGLDGFDVLAQVEKRNFAIIFQTAYDKFAVRAFEESACDYLLKPFTIERFEKAFKKASAQIANAPQDFATLESSLRKSEVFLEKLTARQGARTHIIPVQDIICLVSRDHYTCIHTNEAEHVIELSLSFLEDKLAPQHFLRCHRNNIVALPHVKSVGGTTDSMMELSNGMELPVSRSNRKRLMERLAPLAKARLNASKLPLVARKT